MAKGLVVVASAGNTGKDAEGRTVLGSVSTPGNAPGVITVGALNTWNTVSRDDDTVTTYSSRGPTRYDMMLKPDVVAPGNKIVSLEAAGLVSRDDLSVAARRGQRHQRLFDDERHQHGRGDGQRRRGAVAAVDAEPDAAAGEGGAAGHRGVHARSGLGRGRHRQRQSLRGAQVSSGNDGLLGVLSTLLIGGQPVTGSGFAYLKPGARLDQSSRRTGARVRPDRRRASRAGAAALSTTTPSQIIWGDTNMWTADQQIIWGDQIFNPAGQQIIWGDQVYNPSGQQIIWGDQIYNPSGQQIIWGDPITTQRQPDHLGRQRSARSMIDACARSPRSTFTSRVITALGRGGASASSASCSCRRRRTRANGASSRCWRWSPAGSRLRIPGTQRLVLDLRHVLHRRRRCCSARRRPRSPLPSTAW